MDQVLPGTSHIASHLMLKQPCAVGVSFTEGETEVYREPRICVTVTHSLCLTACLGCDHKSSLYGKE